MKTDVWALVGVVVTTIQTQQVLINSLRIMIS
ncbi:MAG: hypothetical protein ACJAZE_001480, partial [Halioglobus sp.]